MNRRVRKSMLEDAGLPRMHVGEIIPPDINPIIKEFVVGRNDNCPCGSRIKYKKCCLEKYTYENYK